MCQAGLSCKHKLGGIIALSAWLALRDKLRGLIAEENKQTPIFQAHGELDSLVRYEWGTTTRDDLRGKYGLELEWHSYPDLEHSADPREINDMQTWLEKRIPSQDS